jgi:hypothetical protein
MAATPNSRFQQATRGLPKEITREIHELLHSSYSIDKDEMSYEDLFRVVSVHMDYSHGEWKWSGSRWHVPQTSDDY